MGTLSTNGSMHLNDCNALGGDKCLWVVVGGCVWVCVCVWACECVSVSVIVCVRVWVSRDERARSIPSRGGGGGAARKAAAPLSTAPSARAPRAFYIANIGFGGCLGVHHGGIAAEGRVETDDVFGGDYASRQAASKHPMFHEQLTPAMRANGASAVAAFKGPAAFHELVVEQNWAVLAVVVDGLLAAKELTARGRGAVSVEAWKFDVKYANCEAAGCAFAVDSSNPEWLADFRQHFGGFCRCFGALLGSALC